MIKGKKEERTRGKEGGKGGEGREKVRLEEEMRGRG